MDGRRSCSLCLFLLVVHLVIEVTLFSVFVVVLIFPSSHCLTYFHEFLHFVPDIPPISSASLDRYLLFASATVIFWMLLASLSCWDSLCWVCSSLHSLHCFSRSVTAPMVGWIRSLLCSNQSNGSSCVLVAVASPEFSVVYWLWVFGIWLGVLSQCSVVFDVGFLVQQYQFPVSCLLFGAVLCVHFEGN